MTTLHENLERPVVQVGGVAQRNLASLRTQRGYVVLAGTSANPTWVRIARMEGVSHWRHLNGRGQGAIYEQEVES